LIFPYSSENSIAAVDSIAHVVPPISTGIPEGINGADVSAHPEMKFDRE
jgi:hypothetical protein